jgi:hypothetical protein
MLIDIHIDNVLIHIESSLIKTQFDCFFMVNSYNMKIRMHV